MTVNIMEEKESVPSVEIVVVNYNGKTYLSNCLSSLLAMDYPQERFGITVVDNISSDGSIEFIQANFPRVKVIKNTVNNYARANNLGIMDSKCDYVCFVNNDVYVDKKWLAELIKVVNTEDSIGCAGGKVLFTDGRIQSAGHQEFPGHYWGDKGLGEADLGQYDRLEEVLSLSGSAVLFKRKCLDDVGYFDEDFEMYLEDVDIFLRCRKKGWKICYVPDAIAHHKFHGSITPERVERYIRRNRLLLIAKHFPEKLGDAFAGKEVFSGVEPIRLVSELCDILPLVFSKMIDCHGQEITIRVVPEILKNLRLVFNYERDRAIQYLNAEKERLSRVIEERDRIIDGKEERIDTFGLEINAEKQMREEQKQIWAVHEKEFEKTIQSLLLELERIKGISDERHQRIESLESDIRAIIEEKERLRQEFSLELKEEKGRIGDEFAIREGEILRLNSELITRRREVEEFKSALQEIRESETYRFINKPIWRVLDFLKAIRIIPSRREKRKDMILVIKPQEVTLAQTESAIRNLRSAFPDAAIALLANVSEREYGDLNRVPFIDEKIYYSPEIKKLTRLEMFKLLFVLPRKRFRTAFVLVGATPPGYGGYRRAQILAWLSGSRSRVIYDVLSPAPVDILRKEDRRVDVLKKIKGFSLLLQHGIRWFGSQILFAGFLLFFLIFIVGGIKVRRMVSNLRGKNR